MISILIEFLYEYGLIFCRTHEAFMNYGVPEEERRERLEFVRTNLEANPLLDGKIPYDPPAPPQA